LTRADFPALRAGGLLLQPLRRTHVRTRLPDASRRQFHAHPARPHRLGGLHALIFDFLDFRTGQLDPAQKTIAQKAGISPRSAARGLANLKLSGVLNWLRRCKESFTGGRFTLEQETNAYAILPSSQWRGYVEPPEAPPPQSGTWGDHPCGMRDPLIEANIERRNGT